MLYALPCGVHVRSSTPDVSFESTSHSGFWQVPTAKVSGEAVPTSSVIS